MKNVAVRDLAYFTCRNGDLTIETFSNREENDGKLAHKFIQSKYNSNSKAEVYIKSEIKVNNNDYLLHGYIDGILTIDDKVVIEEIKSTNADLDLINLDDHKEHIAQAKIYSFLYCLNNSLDTINVRLTYINLGSYITKSFNQIYKYEELEDFVYKIIEEYDAFLTMVDNQSINRQKTINEISFPFKDIRLGQRDLMKTVYQALKDKEIVYAIAPTGIGKTMATIFPALKTLNKMDKLFYLTAKGSGKNAPLDAMKILSKQGLKCKTIDITAKTKICNRKTTHCNPDDCPFAIGYYDRLKYAMLDIYDKYDIFDYNLITEVTNKHKICAFEFSLYLSYFCDMIIADYNYVFDPHAHLVRYFDDDTYKSKVLVDEAHNLISRSKDMYSALIEEENVRKLRRLTNGLDISIRKECNKVINKLESFNEVVKEKAIYVSDTLDLDLISAINVLINSIDNLISSYKSNKKKIPNLDSILECYYELLGFRNVSDYFSKTHRFVVRVENEYIIVEIMCLDAGSFINDTITNSINGIVFFSATLYPIDYHMNLITHNNGKYIELKSPFNPNNLDIIINNNVSTKYRNREESIDSIIENIEILVNSKPGNYMVFFPSYKYLEMVKDKLMLDDVELIYQVSNMTDIEKNEVINKYKNTNNSKVGLFVLGGAFSEGVDLIGDFLSGVIIVGVGLPMVCDENNILKDYFEEQYKLGYDYAYTYPGFTKVIQAVGRVIRDKDDRGIAILMDERFTYNGYRILYPPHWKNIKVINNSYNLKKELEYFYKEKNKNGL